MLEQTVQGAVSVEPIEHALLHCPWSCRFWRSTRLGFNFEDGDVIPFKEWFFQWIKNAPAREDIEDSILYLWLIWKSRNKPQFDAEPQDIRAYQIQIQMQKSAGRRGQPRLDGMLKLSRELLFGERWEFRYGRYMDNVPGKDKAKCNGTILQALRCGIMQGWQHISAF